MMKIRKWMAFALVTCTFNLLEATQYQPWLGNTLEFEWRTSLLYQNYSSLSSGGHYIKHPANNLFLDASLSNAFDNFGGELEVVAASTRRQAGNIDHFKATGRVLWDDDIAGDPFTLTIGLSLSQAFWPAVRDVSSFHHGRGEAELFISVGQETADEIVWDSRWWAMTAFGAGDRGSPWVRIQFAYEKRYCVLHEFKIFLNTLCGLGHKRLKPHDFHGYGSIRHRSVDLGVRYTYVMEYFGSASLEYAYRVYGLNFPVNTHQVLAQILYTFGL